MTIAACGSRTQLDEDPFFRASAVGDDDGGLVDGARPPPIDGGGVDSSYIPPPRSDAGKLLGCGGNLPPPLLITHRDYFGNVSCIDATEVTNDDYAAFLAANPAPSGQSAACASKGNYVPSSWPAPGDRGDYPVVNVDWCDARAYCLWAGKDLCRNHSNDPGNPAFAGDPQIDGWSAACTGNRAQAYPYGANFDIQACNGKDLGLGQVTPVKIPPGCQGSDRGVYGMSGNVWEWEDACDDETSANGMCLIRGGSFRSDPVALRCDSSQRTPRTATRDDVGFRCCID